MTGKRTWVLFGLVGAVAGLAWAVKSGRMGGNGASPVPIMMTPAVTLSDVATSGAVLQKPNHLPATASAVAVEPVSPLKPQSGVKSPPLTVGVPPARPSSTPSRAGSPPRSSLDTPRIVQRADVPDGLSVEQVLEQVRAGRLAEARETLKALPSTEGSAQLVRVVTDLDRDLMEISSSRRAADWYQLEKVLERWDRPGRVVPRLEPTVVAEARAWVEAQRRLRVSQKEWRFALEEALRLENRARIEALLNEKEYPDDPIRAKARDRLAKLESSEKRLAEIREHLRFGRLEAAERLLPTSEPRAVWKLKNSEKS